jgi:hypothetical protein
MLLRGKLNCSVSDEISNKIFESLLKMKVPAEEAYLISRNCRSIKEARSKLSPKIPEIPNIPIEEEKNPIFPVSSVPLSSAKQDIYQTLMKYGTEPTLAEQIAQICDNMDEAMLNAGLSTEEVSFKQSKKNAGLFTYKKKIGEQEKCSICLEFFEEGDPLKTLPCFHKFHGECIKRWLDADNKKCPVCNEEVKYD